MNMLVFFSENTSIYSQKSASVPPRTSPPIIGERLQSWQHWYIEISEMERDTWYFPEAPRGS